VQVAALQAEQTFLTKLEISLVGGSVPGPDVPVTVQAKTVLAQLQEANRWRADLVVDVRAQEGQPPLPYEIAIAISGIFRVVSEIESETARRLAFVNGMSILYSSVRETVLLMTGRFPAGPFVLPTLSFIDEYDRLTPMGVAETPAPYGEKQ
jgi:preprotein translocase subunit SecB